MTIAEILLVLSWVLQLIGLLIILRGNVSFWLEARTGKFHSVKKEFVHKTVIQILPSDKELLEADADQILKKFILPRLLYENYRDSMIGVVVTLVGVILGAVTFTQV